MLDVSKNIDEYDTGKRCKVFLVFDDMIADTINNKRVRQIVMELFI